ncbi:Histidine phosphatase superfamily (branch 1) [Arthrobacter sp. ov407]|nr:Histidine phosphatase superfamily (branch 1) [Arthrobacter sp. ov407]
MTATASLASNKYRRCGQRRLQGSTDIPLNDVGGGQARDAVATLSGYEWDAILSSPLSGAANTADLIAAGLGLSVDRRVPELTERSFGRAEGLQAGIELEALRIPAVPRRRERRRGRHTRAFGTGSPGSGVCQPPLCAV